MPVEIKVPWWLSVTVIVIHVTWQDSKELMPHIFVTVTKCTLSLLWKYFLTAPFLFFFFFRSPVCDEIINCRGDQVRLAIRVRVYAYPEAACATWIMFACKYKSVVWTISVHECTRSLYITNSIIIPIVVKFCDEFWIFISEDVGWQESFFKKSYNLPFFFSFLKICRSQSSYKSKRCSNMVCF